MICAICKKQDGIDLEHVKTCSANHYAPPVIPRTTDEIAATLPDLKRAHYALLEEGRWNFYQVDKPQQGRWAGRTFLSIQASDETHNIRDWDRKRSVFAAIALDPETALRNYGLQLGQCGVCCRTLTDPESISAGIGPVCAGKLGI